MTAKLLSQQGIRVTIIIWDGTKMDQANLKYLEDQDICSIGLTGNVFKKLVSLQRCLGQKNITLILSYLTLANVMGALASLRNRSIISVGGIRSEQLPSIKFLVERFVHNRINHCTVFNSHAARDGFVRRGFDHAKTRVIHNAIVVPPLSQSHNGNEIRIITVSRFVKAKDFPTALRSFRILIDRNRDKNLRFLIVGYGKYEKTIRRLIKHYTLEGEVEIIIDPPNVRELLTSSDIYLSTSLAEGLSNSIMEAMASGLPVVATDAGDSRYLTEDSKNGFIVPAGDAETIAGKLELLVQSDELREEYGRYGYNKINTGFTEEMMLRRYLELIEELSLSGIK